MIEALFAPFAEFAFMRRALAGALILTIAAAPIGVFLILRRMSLTGDAVAHGVLPGVAAGYILGGSTAAMALGGAAAGLGVAVTAGLIARATDAREDASLAALYLVALALGVALIAARAPQLDVAAILFGSALSLDGAGLAVVAIVASLALIGLAAIWPALVLDTADPGFLRSVSRSGAGAHALFLGAVVLVLVAGFQAMGTLMSVGLMVLPAAAARFWAQRLWTMIGLAWLFGAISAAAGLLASFYWDAPSGPAIVLAAGAIYAVSVLVGAADGMATRLRPQDHLSG